MVQKLVTIVGDDAKQCAAACMESFHIAVRIAATLHATSLDAVRLDHAETQSSTDTT